MSNNIADRTENEVQIRQLVENWTQAVRDRDIDAILAHHTDDIVMYDVPKPFQSVGIHEYRRTWDTFFAFTKAGVFNIQQLQVFSADNIAFCFGTMKCSEKSNSVDFVDLDFRLTIGLKKINDEWAIVHEHHSIPSE